MPAKKKRTAAYKPFTDAETIAALKAQVADEQQINKDMIVAIQEKSHRIAKLEGTLAAKSKELERYDCAFAAIDGERTFLWEEIDRFRDRLLDYIRWEMQLPESARVALNKVRAQEFEDKLDEDAGEAT